MTRNVPYVTRLFCVKHPVQGRKSATTLGKTWSKPCTCRRRVWTRSVGITQDRIDFRYGAAGHCENGDMLTPDMLAKVCTLARGAERG